MNYQAPLTLEYALLSLKDEYLIKTKVDFKAPPPSKTGIFFGYKDTDLRRYQINLLEAIAKTDNPTCNHHEKSAYFEKFQLMVAACYLIKAQIFLQNRVTPIYSELNQLLDSALSTTNNPIDRHTLKECLLVFINCNKDKINATLRNNKHCEITSADWQDLKELANQSLRLQKDHDDSPIADPLSYAGGLVFQPMGWGIGFALGQTLGKAGQSALVKNTLTTGLTSAMICFGPLTGSSAAAAIFFARPHAEQAVEYAAGYGAAQLCGYMLKKIGQGIGWALGKSIEIVYDTSAEIGSKALNMIKSGGEVVELDIKIGLDLVHKELTCKSRQLSHEDFIQKIQEVVIEQANALENDDSDSQPKTLSFAMSTQERKLLPAILKKLGYDNKLTHGDVSDEKNAKEVSLSI